MRAEASRAIAWGAGLALVAGLLGVRLLDGVRFDTDVLALLPADQRHPVASAALATLDRQAPQRILYLVDAPTPERAAKAADLLEHELRAQATVASANARAPAELATAWLDLYRPMQGLLLSAEDRELLQNGRAAELAERARRDLYAPTAWSRPLSPADDPFGVQARFLTQLSVGPTRLQSDGQRLWSDGGNDDRAGVLVSASTREPAFALSEPQQLLDELAAAVDTVRQSDPQVRVLAGGIPLHAAGAAARARQEVATIGSLSLVGVVLLVLALFGSLRPLLLTLVCVSSGLLLAVTVSLWTYPHLHLLTLVVGASLVGITVDYSFHFLARHAGGDEGPLLALAKVRTSIGLCLTTTVLGFGGLLLAPIPGLNQMAWFSIWGLVGAWATVELLFPLAASARSRAMPATARRLASRALHLPAWVRIATALCLVLVLPFALTLRGQDDARALHRPDAQRLAEDIELGQRIGAPDPGRLLLVEAADSEGLLQQLEALGQALDPVVAAGGLGGYLSVHRALPSLDRQRQDRDLLKALFAPGGELEAFASATGLGPERVRALRARWAEAPHLTPEQWLASPASEPLRGLWVGGGVATVLLVGIEDEQRLRGAIAGLPGVSVYDRVAALGELLGGLRRTAAGMISAAFLLAAALLLWRLGWSAGLRALVPPLGAGLAVLGVLGATATPFTLFHLFGLLLVLGLAADYGIFLRTAGDHAPAAWLAVLAAALTTLLAFGLLAMSSTPALQAFGEVVAIGICAALWLATVFAPPDAE